jgi:hypothetical protein
MSVSTITRPTTIPTSTPVEQAVDVETLGDDILLGAAAAESATFVAGSSWSSIQSHNARAWTMGGQVD